MRQSVQIHVTGSEKAWHARYISVLYCLPVSAQYVSNEWSGIAQSVWRLRYGLDGLGIESGWGRGFP
jgi:hypothetical protein